MTADELDDLVIRWVFILIGLLFIVGLYIGHMRAWRQECENILRAAQSEGESDD